MATSTSAGIWRPGAKGAAPPRTIVVAAVDEIFRVAGTPTHPATAIRIVNLTLTQTAPTYMKYGNFDIFLGLFPTPPQTRHVMYFTW